MNVLALLQSLHGALAVLAVAACAHPAWTLRSDRAPSSRVRWSVGLAVGLTIVSVVLGWWIYPDYRELIKPWLLERHPRLHQLAFELKEALGFFSLVGAVGGGGLVAIGSDDELARKAARNAFALATLVGLVSAILGIAVVAYRDFGGA